MERIESTKIKFNYKDTDFCLEVTPATLKKMEHMGVKFGQLDDLLVTAGETLFNGTFLEHHPTTSDKLKSEIYGKLNRKCENSTESGNGDELLTIVAEMYKTAIAEIANRGNEGEIGWTVTGG